jgi:uncharacterized protein YrrD
MGGTPDSGRKVSRAKLEIMKTDETSTPVSAQDAAAQETFPLRSTKQLYGDTLHALDGEIGHLKDFYFDDQQWVIRYVVATTGSWLSGRMVLLAPHAFTDFEQDGGSRRVNLTRQQIQDSPAIDLHKPVSRQFEEQYYDYYQWSPYWCGSQIWGGGSYPVFVPFSQLNSPASQQERGAATHNDPHLRSTQAVAGYKIHTNEGEVGHVTDFIVHAKTWAITHLIVETGHWYAGKEIAIAPRHVERISYNNSQVFLDLSKTAMLEAPEYHVPAWAYGDTRNIAD